MFVGGHRSAKLICQSENGERSIQVTAQPFFFFFTTIEQECNYGNDSWTCRSERIHSMINGFNFQIIIDEKEKWHEETANKPETIKAAHGRKWNEQFCLVPNAAYCSVHKLVILCLTSTPQAHLHVVGTLRFMFLTQTSRACPLLFILLLCRLLSLRLFQLYFIP